MFDSHCRLQQIFSSPIVSICYIWIYTIKRHVWTTFKISVSIPEKNLLHTKKKISLYQRRWVSHFESRENFFSSCAIFGDIGGKRPKNTLSFFSKTTNVDHFDSFINKNVKILKIAINSYYAYHRLVEACKISLQSID